MFVIWPMMPSKWRLYIDDDDDDDDDDDGDYILMLVNVCDMTNDAI